MNSAKPLAPDDLIALNDELASLVRAGVPLEGTLGGVGRDLPGRLGKATRELAAKVERGTSLPQAMDQMRGVFPPLYRAAVEAGLRAGRLSVVLEDLARSARRMAELRRVMVLAAIYPLILLFVAFSLLTFFLKKVLPNFTLLHDGHPPASVRALVRLREIIGSWDPAALIVVLVVLALVCIQLLRKFGLHQRLPIVGRMLRDARLASFSETLSLLVRHDVPLAEAMPLAAEATGDRSISQAAEQFSGQLRQGASPSALIGSSPQGLPQFLVWLIATGHRRETLASLLEHAAETYRRHSLRRADWLRFYLPALATAVIGGVTVLLYTLTLFVPLTDLLKYLAG